MQLYSALITPSTPLHPQDTTLYFRYHKNTVHTLKPQPSFDKPSSFYQLSIYQLFLARWYTYQKISKPNKKLCLPTPECSEMMEIQIANTPTT